jgi:type II secretory pathway component PulJ
MKKSFTLIEILISVMIMSILFLALGDIVKNLNKTKDVLSTIYKRSKKENLALKVLYYDLLNAENIRFTKNKDICNIYIRTSNSLHNISMPYVFWYVSKNKNTLLRAESVERINILSKNQNFYLDKFAQNVKIFKVYKKNGKYFVYLETSKPIYFEMYKGF